MSTYSFSVLKTPGFRLLLLTRMMTMMALVSQDVIIGWQIYSLTHDVFLLGLTGLAEALPAIACALVAGHIVDISQPQKIYLLCIGGLAINALTLAAFGGGYIPAPNAHLVAILFGGIFVSGLMRSFLMPSSFSLLPLIVARKNMPAAASWLASGFQVATICGPAIAGIIYGGYGAHGAWVIPAGLIAIAFFLASNIKARRAAPAEKRPPALESIRAGWIFILGNPVLLSVMALDMFAVLFGGAVAMLPAYADQILHVGSEGLGALRAGPAIGAVLTALVFAVRPMKVLTARRLMMVVAGFGLCMIGFGLSTSFWLSMLFLALSGCCDSVSMIIRGTMMQLLTPEHMRGRVSAVNSMFIISSNEIGAFESGVTARFLGLVPSVVIGGLATLCVVGITAFVSPKFRKAAINSEDAA